MENLKFVFTHSAHLLPFALGFLLLGFLFGFFHWARWARELRRLKKEELTLEQTRPTAYPTEQTVRTGTEDVSELSTSRPGPQVSVPDVAAGAGAAGAIGAVPIAGEAFRFNDISFDNVTQYHQGVAPGVDLFQGEEDLIEFDDELGVLYKQRPLQVDDLSQFAGISRDAEERMNNRGIYTFKQLRSLSDIQRTNLEKRFNLPSMNWNWL